MRHIGKNIQHEILLNWILSGVCCSPNRAISQITRLTLPLLTHNGRLIFTESGYWTHHPELTFEFNPISISS